MPNADKSTGKPAGKSRRTIKLAGISVLLLIAVLLTRFTGLSEYVGFESIGRLQAWIDGFGLIAPVVFVALYVAATVAFLPATPLTLLGGLVFGAVWGTVWSWVGATLGATLAFLVGRYAARGMVESWREKSERLRKLDEGVEKHGWRMLLITRLVPVFPFNLQNYAYGLTRIRLATYVLLTAVCILPGVVVYTFAGGSLAAAQENLVRTFTYLGVAAVFFVLLSLVPRWIQRRNIGGDSP